MTQSHTRGGTRILRICGSLLLAIGSLLASSCGGGSLNPSQNENGHKSLSSIVISPTNPTVAIGDTERFVVTGIYSDKSTQDVTSSVTWSVDDSSIATIDPTGLATAKRSGVAKITASSGELSATVDLTVASASLVSITITPPLSTVSTGGTEQLTAMGSFTDGTTQDLTATVTWSSSAPTVAAVSNTGLVSGMAAGTAMITASSNLIRGAETLTVTQPSMVSLAIAPANASVAKGKTQQLSVTATFAGGSTADVTATVAWTVSPSAVASVSATGLATGLATGTAKITAIAGSISGSTNLVVTPAVLVSLAVTPPNPSIGKGSTQQLTVTGTFSDGSAQNITGSVAWTVSPVAVVGVSSTGVVTALATGTASVTASSGSISGSDTITVTAASLTLIAVSPAAPSIFTGKTQQLTATGTYADGSSQDITGRVSWTGSVSGVLTLSSAGLVTAQGAGTATVSATSGSISGSDTITVSAVTLTSIAITPANPSVPRGETQQLIAAGSYNDGSTQDLSSKVTWSGGIPGTVDLSATGLITATKQGTATITATDGSVSGSTTVTVSAAVPVSIAVSPATATVTVGFMQAFTAVATYSDGTTKSVTKSATWTSASPAIATVDPTGTATGASAGVININATYRSVTGSGSLTVIPVLYLATETEAAAGASSYTYFDQSNTSGVDATLRISDSSSVADNVCAMVYVFSADQQLAECCGCKISKNGLRTLSLTTDLISNPLTGQTPTSGTIEVDASDISSNPTCDPGQGSPSGTLTVWATHIQASTIGTAPSPAIGSQSASSGQEFPSSIQTQCQYVQQLGSGQGVCTCGTGD